MLFIINNVNMANPVNSYRQNIDFIYICKK